MLAQLVRFPGPHSARRALPPRRYPKITSDMTFSSPLLTRCRAVFGRLPGITLDFAQSPFKVDVPLVVGFTVTDVRGEGFWCITRLLDPRYYDFNRTFTLTVTHTDAHPDFAAFALETPPLPPGPRRLHRIDAAWQVAEALLDELERLLKSRAFEQAAGAWWAGVERGMITWSPSAPSTSTPSATST